MIPTWMQQIAAGGGGGGSNWILLTAFWRDVGVWEDTANWID